MSFPPSEAPSGADLARRVVGSLALLLGSLAVYALVWGLLEPPSTWTRCPEPSASELADLSARRNDFLPIAVPLVTAYGVIVAALAWKWASDRRARQGHRRHPGQVATTMTVAYGTAWAFLIPHAFTADKVGGAGFWGFVFAAAGVVLSTALASGILIAALLRPRRSWGDVLDELAVGLTWSILLFGVPLFLVLIGMAGKDATLWC